MKVDRRVHGDETANLAALLETFDHLRQRRVGQAVAVVGEENLLVLHEMPDRHQSLTDIAPDSGVDQRNAPIRRRFAQDFDLLAETRNDAVAVCRLLVVQEVVLDDVRLVAEAQNEILMPVLAVVLHDVPQDRLMADRDHRLRNALRIFADARTEPATEQDNLHDASSSRIYHLDIRGSER